MDIGTSSFWGSEATVSIVYIAVVIVVVLVSMTLHEAMHAFAGYWLGDDTAKLHGRLSFNPIKHIDPFLTIILPIMLAIVGAPIFGAAKPVPFNPDNVRGGEWGAALVALAGPLSNLVLAFLLFAVWVVAGLPQDMAGSVIVTAISVNLGFFVFNMIPIPPLDGSRLLYALAPDFVRRGMEAMENFGILIVFAILLLAGPSFYSVLLGGINFFWMLFGRFFGL